MLPSYDNTGQASGWLTGTLTVGNRYLAEHHKRTGSCILADSYFAHHPPRKGKPVHPSKHTHSFLALTMNTSAVLPTLQPNIKRRVLIWTASCWRSQLCLDGSEWMKWQNGGWVTRLHTSWRLWWPARPTSICFLMVPLIPPPPFHPLLVQRSRFITT